MSTEGCRDQGLVRLLQVLLLNGVLTDGGAGK